MEEGIVNNYFEELRPGTYSVQIIEIEYRNVGLTFCNDTVGVALITFCSLEDDRRGIFKQSYFMEDADPYNCIETARSRKFFLNYYLNMRGESDLEFYESEHLDLIPYVIESKEDQKKYITNDDINNDLFFKNKKTGKMHFVGERFSDLISKMDDSKFKLYEFKGDPKFFDESFLVNRKTKERIKSMKYAEKINRPLIKLFSDVGEPFKLTMDGYDLAYSECVQPFGRPSYLTDLIGKKLIIEICTDYEKKEYDRKNAKNAVSEIDSFLKKNVSSDSSEDPYFDSDDSADSLKDAGFYLDVDGNMHEIENDDEDIWGDLVAEEERNYDRESAYADLEPVFVLKDTFPFRDNYFKKIEDVD